MSIDRGLRGVALGFVRSVLDLFAPISLFFSLFSSLFEPHFLFHLSLSRLCTYSLALVELLFFLAALVNPS